MKKTSAALLMIFLIALPALAKSITITSPVAGIIWQIGKHQNITWIFDGIPASAPIRIVLWQNGSKVDNIALNLTAGQGSYDWTVGTTQGGQAQAGSGYSIRIRTEDNSAIGNSGSFILSAAKTIIIPPQFTIDPNKLNPTKNIEVKFVQSIGITSPKAGDTVDPYNVVYVYWTMLGALDPNVSVTLLRNGAAVATLAASTPNNGAFNWDSQALSPDPGPYTIKVKTLDGKCEAVSGQFTMKETGGIEILSPKGGEVWESGTSHAVTWKRMGNIQTLNIFLKRYGSNYMTLAQGVSAKLGTKTCVFIRDGIDGTSQPCYAVFINHSGGNTVQPSGCFTLTGNPDLAVSATFSPSMFYVGTDVTFAVKVNNIGAVRSQPCQGSLSFNSSVLKIFSIPAIDPGTSATVNVHWFYSGQGTITITADTGNANIEPDKSNNTWAHIF
jgi:hypothetical protein